MNRVSWRSDLVKIIVTWVVLAAMEILLQKGPYSLPGVLSSVMLQVAVAYLVLVVIRWKWGRKT